ncbi:aldehyde dehydrogenase family protein [Lysinibacillus sp. FSL K6-4013]|uniref:aldehyde dehydrogenase family protein n=1 Tax=Lysinibacillus sp. FSL K6-4013 TaxID=2921504 RepID=UPI00315A10D2
MLKKLYINGQWKESTTYTILYSPFTNEAIAQIPVADIDTVEEAIQSASQAKKEMANLTSLEKSKILTDLANILEQRRLEAAQIISLESAKPLKYSLAEIDRTVETYRFSAEEAKRISGETIQMDAAKNGKGRVAYTQREPLGAIAAITPFNFPFNLVAHKIGPAIASGNTIVLKPASQTPLSAYFIAELLDQTDLPKGAFNVITGKGGLIGDYLVQHDEIDMVTFTGSPEVGIGIRNKAGLKKVALELGSNAGLIIDKNVTLQKIIEPCVVGAFSNQGQVCISLQRIYVMQELMEEFIELFKKATEKLNLGDPLEAHTDISSLIHQKENERILTWIDEALSRGATLLTGGEVMNGILKPTILSNVPVDAKLSCEEIFGPVVTISSINSVDEGIEAINNSKYGLQAGIFTENIKEAFKAISALKVGGVIVNDIPTYRVDQMPYGGVKQSGNAREGIKYTIQEMTEMKLVVWNNN